VLARCIDAYAGDIEFALSRYESVRRDRTTNIVLKSTEMSKRFHSAELAKPDHAAQFVEREWHPNRVNDSYNWIFEYDARSVAI
jgi:2-polyprenyl-6-methoxyphenol hydroxylase-like FAD-dependent oxidoreductase